ncbi:MAG TPA: hypothetical protein VHK05_06905 [Candidatus Limnocylindrales bacterium]|nr:hypothetical protein [Candidatus Limnocylindrales bacterium]
MASEQDAARDRVLAARAGLETELDTLRASGRAAIDIPARIRQSPAKAAALGGAVGFLLLRGPQRLYRAVRKAIFGTPAPMPKKMLPKEIEKTLRSMGEDGEKVRGTLERDFAAYVKKAEKDRKGLLSVALMAMLRPMLARGAKRAGEYLFSPSPEGYATGLDEVRARAERAADAARVRAERAAEAAKDRVDQVRQPAHRDAEEESPTGI